MPLKAHLPRLSTSTTRSIHSSTYHNASKTFSSSSAPSSVSGIFSRGAKSSEADSKAMNMLSAIGNRNRNRDRLQGEDDERVRFTAGKMIQPSHLTSPRLTSKPPNYPTPPLLAPSEKLSRTSDPFYQTGTSPLDHVFNPLFSYAMVNEVGRIKPRSETGLTLKNQKLMGKMVRRARGMGLISGFSNRASVGGLGSGFGNSRYSR